MKRKTFFSDIALIAALLAVAAAAFLLAGGKRSGAFVEVTVGGEPFGAYSLKQDGEFDIAGLCTLKIENGEARVVSAVCRNQICVKHRPISRAGESTVCLPSRVTFRITGEGADFYV